jgi:hypothetical protein
METQCLICESSAVIDRQAARTIVLAISALREFMQAQKILQLEKEPTQWLLHCLSNAMDAITRIHPDVQSFIADIERYQFGGFDCLCLRCGAQFDTPSGAASGTQPGSQ